jgi:uncharacterized hydrophobic protein (TIGR00271 family)
MRQLFIQVPRGGGKRVLEIARSCEGINLAQLEGSNAEEAIDLVLIHVSNGQVEQLLSELEEISGLHVSFMPTGVMTLYPPPESAPQQVKNVEERSPIEIFLSGLQSVGSWKGFLSYAALAGVVVWTGLFTNTQYLLVAAMLIAPFAGPAMNVAIATARGDYQHLWRSVLRYVAALTVTVLVAASLSLILRQEIPTSLAIEQSQISAVAVLLPLAAGAAGAINLVQSDRSSLVSGAATGMLVAASLAPPAGIIGMAGAIGRWDLVVNGAFLLVLQLFGINVAATFVFRLFGLTSQGTRYQRGKPNVFKIALLLSTIALIGILGIQFADSPELQRSSQAQRANTEVQNAIEAVGVAELVEANVRFTRPEIEGQNTLLCVVYVQRREDTTLSDAEIQSQITQSIQQRLQAQEFDVTPLVDVTVLEPSS